MRKSSPIKVFVPSPRITKMKTDPSSSSSMLIFILKSFNQSTIDGVNIQNSPKLIKIIPSFIIGSGLFFLGGVCRDIKAFQNDLLRFLSSLDEIPGKYCEK